MHSSPLSSSSTREKFVHNQKKLEKKKKVDLLSTLFRKRGGNAKKKAAKLKNSQQSVEAEVSYTEDEVSPSPSLCLSPPLDFLFPPSAYFLLADIVAKVG